jgi:uncharacterized protein YbjT (DUF2867 family)
MKILITGSTGKIGSELLKQLVTRKASVRALVRKADSSLPPGVEPVVGDLLDPVSFEKALVGIDKLFLLNGVVADELTQGLIAFGLAKKHKLQHIVYNSVFKAEHFKDVPHFASKVAIENALKEFSVPFTILRPNYFYQNDLTLKAVLTDFGVYPMPLGTPGLSAVDVRDIAEAAAVVLTTEGHLGKTYNVVGPDVLSGPQVASIWSAALGKPIQYPGEHMDAFEEQLRTQVPSWAAYDFRMMMQGYLERGFAATPEDVATLTKLLGHAPRRYVDFANEAAQTWTKN